MKLGGRTLFTSHSLVERAPIEFGELTLGGSGEDRAKVSIRAKTSTERDVNTTENRCES